jgi:glycosyltransferase involved in cell wall biosynthesis
LPENKPKISIITVVYNGASVLEATLQSIVAQTYKNIEIIVIDGASTDQTPDIIQRYANHIHYHLCQPDTGIYDAMNKALRAATGDYLWFINAGDQVFAPDTLTQIFEHTAQPYADIYYGEAVVINQNNQIIGYRKHRPPTHLTPRSLQQGMVVSHQAFIPKRSIAPMYDPQYKICADIDWVIRCLHAARTTHHTQQVLARFLEDGISSQKYTQAWAERYKVLAHHYGFFANLYNHFFIITKYIKAKF